MDGVKSLKLLVGLLILELGGVKVEEFYWSFDCLLYLLVNMEFFVNNCDSVLDSSVILF